MVEKNERKVLRMLCASIVLDFTGKQGTRQYTELERFISYQPLNLPLKELLDHRLIEHYLERIEKKREWYELTIKESEPCSAQSSSWNYPKFLTFRIFLLL